MRYIVNADNYITAISFGCYIECQDDGCTEYTGSVPTGYASLDEWYADEAEKLYRWKIVDGQLTLDSSAVAPEKDYDHLADKNNPHGVTAEQVGAAPSGYGLASEDSATAVNDANLAVANGWYKCSSSVINIPQNCYEGWIFVESYNAKYKKQTYNNEAYGGIVAQRFMDAGVWGEWEWVNPATGFSTEYRTTQRYAGKPVYRKTINFGYFAAGTHTRNHGIADIEYVVDFEVTNNVYGVYTGQFNAWMSDTQFGFTSPWAAGGICIVASYTKK